MAIFALVAVAAVGVLIYRARASFVPSTELRAPQPADRASMLRKGPPVRFLQPQPVGRPFGAKERPLVAHVMTVDLDKDGLNDIVACDVLANRVVWLRQFPRGTFSEIV